MDTGKKPAKKIRKYGPSGRAFRAEFSFLNSLGQRETETRVFSEFAGPRDAPKNRKAAEAWLRERERIWKEKGTLAAETLTFAAYIEQKRPTHLHEAIVRDGKKVSGLKGWDAKVRHNLKPLLKRFGKARLVNIATTHVDRYRADRLREGLALATVNRELALLRRVLRLAVRDGILTRVPVFEINAAEEVERDRVLSWEEQRRMMATLELRDERGRQSLLSLKPLIVAALATACRAGELRKLTWRDVDLEGGLLNVPQTITKTAKARTIPLTPELRRELRDLHTRRSSDDARVFPVGDYKHKFQKLLAEAGVRDFRFHDLRHTATTRMVLAGMRTEYVMRITGHTTHKTFRRYLNLRHSDLVSEFKKFEQFDPGAHEGRAAAQGEPVIESAPVN